MPRMKKTHHTGELRKTKKGHEFVIGKTDKYGTAIEFINKNGPHRVVKLLNANGAAVRYATELKHKKIRLESH